MNRFLKLPTHTFVVGMMPALLLGETPRPFHKEDVPAERHEVVGRIGMDPEVASGKASIRREGRILDVNCDTDQTVIDWNSFSIDTDETVRLTQPDANSRVIIRVAGDMPVEIAGKLLSNGKVVILSSGGIDITSSGEVENTGFICSSLGFTKDGCAKSGLWGFKGESLAEVRNSGMLSLSSGDVLLVGKHVTNDGKIETRNGDVALIAASDVVLEKSEAGRTTVRIRNVDGNGHAKHAGSIESGRREIFHTHRTNGESAPAIDHAVTDSPGSVANSHVAIHAEGTAEVSGFVSSGTRDRGGAIDISAREVLVTAHAQLNAVGDHHGGTIRVGGGYQGKDYSIRNAGFSTVQAGATIRADARIHGDGGTVIIWADQNTLYSGAISAKGGSQGGDGGFVEVSGKDTLEFAGAVDTTAIRGGLGTLLLDPAGDTVIAALDPLDGSSWVNVALLNAAGANVLLQTEQDLVVNAPVSFSVNGVGMTAQAGRHVFVSQQIVSRGGSISLSANNNWNGNASGTGMIILNAPINTTAGGQVSGAVSLGINGGTGGISLGANITTAGSAGSVSITSGSGGISQINASTINAGAGPISIDGGGGPMNFAGALTTTNTGVTAINLQNASAVILGNCTATNSAINLGSAGNITSGITQTAGTILTADRLTGNTGNTVVLANNNAIATLGAFTTNGNFQLADSGGLSVSASPVTNAGALSISTSGNLSFTGTLVLPGNTSLTGTQLTLAGGITGSGNALILDFSTAFTLPGGITGAGDFTSQKAINLNGTFTTVGSQSYNGAFFLTGNSVLNAVGAIHFNGDVNGSFSLDVNTNGTTTFGGTVGATNALTTLTTNTGGTTAINGGSVTTTAPGGQVYNDAVILGANTTLNAGAGAITFGGSLDGLFGLALNTTGAATFGGSVAGNIGLGIQSEIEILGDETVRIDFESTPGFIYRMQYSHDMKNWLDAPSPIHAKTNQIQLVDGGAPLTASPPSSVTERFYRINRLMAEPAP